MQPGPPATGAPYGPPPYGGFPPPQPAQPTNTLAIIALVLLFVFPPGAVVCGHIARKQIKQTGEAGDGMALASIIIGWCFVGLFVVLVLIWLVFLIFGLALFASIPDTFPTPTPIPSPFPTS